MSTYLPNQLFGTTSITLSFFTGGQIFTISKPAESSKSLHCFSFLPIPAYFIMLMSISEPQTEAFIGGSTTSQSRSFDWPLTRAGMVFSRI